MRIDKSVRVALVVAIAFFMQFLDTTAVNTAIPAMARAFGTDVIHLSTGITSYLIALAIFIPVSGWIAAPVRDAQRVLRGDRVFYPLLDAVRDVAVAVAVRDLPGDAGMAGAMMSPVAAWPC